MAERGRGDRVVSAAVVEGGREVDGFLVVQAACPTAYDPMHLSHGGRCDLLVQFLGLACRAAHRPSEALQACVSARDVVE